ncbi:MAG TPA: hypothetical protein VE130_12870 [Nitrososphaeraceae archaeon]|nr:hypothetical protein [Nitrososphaeraceae archaeon]
MINILNSTNRFCASLVKNFVNNANSIYDWDNQCIGIQQLHRNGVSRRRPNTKCIAYSCYSSGWISSFFIRYLENRDERKKLQIDHIATHCQILFSEFHRYENIIYTGQTVSEHFSKFKYGNYLRQHFQTGHPDIYEPLQKAIQSRETIENGENYKLYSLRLKELSHGIELGTRVLGGACDECLKYYDIKMRKRYETMLNPS